MSFRNHDKWTIDRWRLEPKLSDLKIGDPEESDQAPSLWKDLALACVAALVLWLTAALVFG